MLTLADAHKRKRDGEGEAEPAAASFTKKAHHEGGAAAGGGSSGGDGVTTTVFIKGLPFSVTEDDLRGLFEPCGTIDNIFMFTFEDTGKPRGMAKVKFDTPEAAGKAVGMNGQDVGGRYIGVELNREKDRSAGGGFGAASPGRGGAASANEPTATLFMGNLSFTVTEDDIRGAFDGCGDIISVRIATDKETGAPRGFGHLEFSDVEAAKAAMQRNGSDVAGRSIKLDYAAARAPGGGGGGGFGGGRGGGRGGFGGGFGGGRGGGGGFGGGRGGGRGGGFGGGRGGGRGGFGGGGRGGFGGGGAPENKKMTFDE